MANLNGFNANEVDPNVGFEPLPAGKYLCTIVDSDMKQTRNGAGEYLLFEFQVIDGPHMGRKLWDRLTIKHPNQTTVKIARGMLSALCRAVGVMAPKDSVELHSLPLVVSVGLKKRQDTGELTNVVKAYSKRDAGNTVVGAAAAAPHDSPASSGSAAGGPPWKR
ncbi:MAG: DUF669 domain-containing protein [Phycisphaeraceae bacterium]|nr:MAG: DUF669 domain-containing protein [Phycisphaeraceae bacterium]